MSGNQFAEMSGRDTFEEMPDKQEEKTEILDPDSQELLKLTKALHTVNQINSYFSAVVTKMDYMEK
eukprot:125280-Amorphochlora_amoeboformis.AAC.1